MQGHCDLQPKAVRGRLWWTGGSTEGGGPELKNESQTMCLPYCRVVCFVISV